MWLFVSTQPCIWPWSIYCILPTKSLCHNAGKKPNMECCLGCLNLNTRDENMNCCCNTFVFISERHSITLVFKSNRRIIFSPQMLKQGTTFVIFIACFARRMRFPKNVSAIPPPQKNYTGHINFFRNLVHDPDYYLGNDIDHWHMSWFVSHVR